MLDQLTDKLESVFRKLRGQGKITEENVAESLREVRVALLGADVNYQTVKDFIARVKERAVGEKVVESITPGQLLVKITYDELRDLLGGESAEPTWQGPSPFPVLVMGLQGSGKTTFCGKLALHLREKRHRKPLLVACDVHRPAAIDQLRTIGRSLGIPVYEEEGKDVAGIAERARDFALAQDLDIIIFDTAGRLQIDEELMAELERLSRTVKAQERIIAVDAMTGQDAVNAALEFHRRIGVTGAVLTKLDGDARGGAALSLRSVTGRPIYFASVGEKPADLEVFHPDRLASRILGMGDVVTLVEKAQEVFDEKESRRLEKKMLASKFDLEDFLQQLRQVKKMGSVTDLMGMLPGMPKVKEGDLDEKQVGRVEAVISSMTGSERREPRIIDGERRKRIARGSGTSLQEVNRVLKQFEQMQKMMKQFSSMRKGTGMKQALRSVAGGRGGFF